MDQTTAGSNLGGGYMIEGRAFPLSFPHLDGRESLEDDSVRR